MLTGLSMNQKAEADITKNKDLTENKEKKLTQTAVFTKINISFRKRSDVLMTGFSYFDATTKNITSIKF